MTTNNNVLKGMTMLLLTFLVLSINIQIATADPGPGGIKDDNIVANNAPAGDNNKCVLNVNGGGWILSVKNATSGETVKSTLELNVQANNRVYKGNVKYNDGVGISIKSLDISKVEVYNATYNAVLIEGNASVNGTGSYPFYMTVSDAGEPAKDNDFVMVVLPTLEYNGDLSAGYVPAVPPWIIIWDPYEPDFVPENPYTNYGYISGGNIQVKISACAAGATGGRGGIGF